MCGIGQDRDYSYFTSKQTKVQRHSWVCTKVLQGRETLQRGNS